MDFRFAQPNLDDSCVNRGGYKTMSRSIKTIIAGLCLALATTSTASAQISQMRLFSPFPDDQFGGGVYQHEGFYGSIGAGIVSLSQPSDQIVGSTVGTSSRVLTNAIGGNNRNSYITYVAKCNQMNTSQFRASWETATEFTVGNMIGHHGWEFKGTVVSPQRNAYHGVYGGINIEDPAVVNAAELVSDAPGNYYIWTGNASDPVELIRKGGTYQIGKLWAIVPMQGQGSTGQGYTDNNNNNNSTDSDGQDYVIAPIPITYETFSLRSNVNTWSVEAMYNYRFHPFRRGTLELLAGVRYTEFDGTFSFFGHANTSKTSSYEITDVQILETSTSANVDNASTSTSQEYGSYDYENSSVTGADLGYSDWNFEADNHIIGPQVGVRYTLSNNRWRFIGEAKYFAGFNRQNIYGNGTLGLSPMSDQQTDTSATGGVPTFAPLNSMPNAFAYSKHHDVYSNGIDGKLEAVWNWTQSVGFKVGYQMLYMDNIARATATNDYRLNEDGSIFGVKKDKDDYNFDQFVHGVMFTVMINR